MKWGVMHHKKIERKGVAAHNIDTSWVREGTFKGRKFILGLSMIKERVQNRNFGRFSNKI